MGVEGLKGFPLQTKTDTHIYIGLINLNSDNPIQSINFCFDGHGQIFLGLCVKDRALTIYFGSHLAPKYFKVVTNSKKVGRHLIL